VADVGIKTKYRMMAAPLAAVIRRLNAAAYCAQNIGGSIGAIGGSHHRALTL
jgi:hypothetical protein